MLIVLRLTSQGSLCMVPFNWLDLLTRGTNEQPLLRTLQHPDNHAHESWPGFEHLFFTIEISLPL